MLFSSCSEILVTWQLTKQKIVTDILDFHPIQIIRMLRLSHQVLQEEASGLPFIEQTGLEPPLIEQRVNPSLCAGLGALHLGLYCSATCSPLSSAPPATVSPPLRRNI